MGSLMNQFSRQFVFRRLRQLGTLGMLLLVGPNMAAAATADQIQVSAPQIRLMPPNAKVTAAFMVIKNDGNKSIRLVSAESSANKTTEIHAHLNEGGMLRMRQVPFIELKAKEEVALQPGGFHIMMIGLKSPLREGELIPINLIFDDGSSQQVNARVTPPQR